MTARRWPTPPAGIVQFFVTAPVSHWRRFSLAFASAFACVAGLPVYGFVADAHLSRRATKSSRRQRRHAKFGGDVSWACAGWGFDRLQHLAYPVVWRTAGSMGSPPAQVAAGPRPTPAPAPRPRTVTASERPKSIPTIAENPTAGPVVAVEPRRSAPENLEKPLVPIPRVLTAAMPTVSPVAEGVRRLPPVDPKMPTLVGGDALAASGYIPIYPSTGIQ